jgi:hypothetical protein
MEISGADFPGEKHYGTLAGLWNSQGINNRLKVIIFKFFNNILGINTRLSHFVPNQGRGCTFCPINGTVPVPDETFFHVFMDCGTVRTWHNKFLGDYLPGGYLRDDQERKNFFFLGRVHEPDIDCFFIMMTVLVFQFVVWEQKLRKKCPSYRSIKIEFQEHMGRFLTGNSRARKDVLKSNFILCRKFGKWRGQRFRTTTRPSSPAPPSGRR